MLVYDVEFGITDGLVVSCVRDSLADFSSGLTVQRTLPTVKTRRMATVRNDSGPQEGVLSFRRYGVNVWADSSTDAELMAHAAMSGLRRLPGTALVKATDSFSGPFEVEDDVPIAVGVKPLTHFYFAFRLVAKAVQA